MAKIRDILNKVLEFDNILILVIILLLSNILYVSYSKIINVDEIEGIHTAWKILNGEIIYVDFFQHHHSSYYYLLIPIITIFGESAQTLVIARMVFFIFFLIIVYYTYKIAMLENDKKFAFISIIILLSFVIFSFKAIEVRPDIPQIALIIFSLFKLLESFKYKRNREIIYSALALGFAFVILQKTVIVIAIIGLIQVYYLFRKEFRIRLFMLYWGVFLLSLSPFFIYLLISEKLSIYYTYNWLVNLNNFHRFSPLQELKNSYHQNTIHWIFYFIAIIFIDKERHLKIMSILSIYFIVTLFFMKAPWPQYFIIISPFVSVLTAKGIYSLFKHKVPIMALIILLSIIPYYFELLKTKSNKDDLLRLQYVIDNTSKTDKVFDGFPYINLFRDDIDYFWFSTSKSGLLEVYQNMTNYQYNIYKSIEEHKPKIIQSYLIDNMDHKSIKPYYYKSEKYSTIFIRKSP